MSFLKYPSILNHYRSKEIAEWLEYNPGLADEHFVITEKIHGANIQFIFTPDGEFQLASRNQLTDGTFMGVGETINSSDLLLELISYMKARTQRHGVTYNLYGEYFGKGIQKGVDYGQDKRIMFFDMAMNGVLATQREFFDSFVSDIDLAIPVLGFAYDLEEALAFNSTTETVLGSGICEGVVIKPYYNVYTSPQGSVFYLKKKNDKFKEKQKAPKPVADQPNVTRLNELFLTYVTEQRMYNVFSKEGPITNSKEIGKYIRLILDDAKEEFLAECEEIEELSAGFDKKDWRTVYNCGSVVANMLKKEL